jgi:hypothetical protein
MRSFVLDILVIELCSARGFPLEEASETLLSVIKVLFLVLFWDYSGIIVVLFWLYHCLSSISSYLFMFCIVFYIWNITHRNTRI